METTIRIPNKYVLREKGKHVYLRTKNQEGLFYLIPINAITNKRNYAKCVSSSEKQLYTSITFKNWAYIMGNKGNKLKEAVNSLKTCDNSIVICK